MNLEGKLDPAIWSELDNFDPLSPTDNSQDSQEDIHQDSQENSTHQNSGQESSTVDRNADEL